jgi:hypothetical protein
MFGLFLDKWGSTHGGYTPTGRLVGRSPSCHEPMTSSWAKQYSVPKKLPLQTALLTDMYGDQPERCLPFLSSKMLNADGNLWAPASSDCENIHSY